MISMKNKKAAMEMSVGTIVTIVLLMTVLILGLVMIRTIFKGSIENINSVDQSVKNEINKLFSEDTSRPVVVYPTSRLIIIKKGNQDYLGFAFSIRNLETEKQTFTYEIKTEGNSDCKISSQEALSWIKAGGRGSTTVSASSSMTDPEFVRFLIPSTTPACLIRYNVMVNDGEYSDISVDLKVEAS